MIGEQELQQFIQQVFQKYDRDRSGSLDAMELTNFFNDVFQQMGNQTRFNQQQAMQALRVIDKNSDGKASQQELYMAFKQILIQQGKFKQVPGGGMGGGMGGQQQGGWGQQGGGMQQGGQWGGQQGGQYGGQQPGQQGGQWGGQQPGQQGGWGQQGGQGQPGQQGGWGQQPGQQGGQWGGQQPGQQGGQQGGWGQQGGQSGWK